MTGQLTNNEKIVNGTLWYQKVIQVGVVRRFPVYRYVVVCDGVEFLYSNDGHSISLNEYTASGGSFDKFGCIKIGDRCYEPHRDICYGDPNWCCIL
jgi:hypothetical protein